MTSGLRGTGTAILLALLLITSFCVPADALSSASASTSNPNPGAMTNTDLQFSGRQTTTPVRCIEAKFSGGYAPRSTLYSFDSGAQGFTYTWGDTPNSVAHDTSRSQSGAGSLAINRTYGSGWSATAVGDNYGGLRDLSAGGDSLSTWIYVPANASGTWLGAIYVVDAGYDPSSSAVVLSPGQWTKVTHTPPAGVIANMRSVIVQVDGTNANGNYTINVDTIQQGPSVSNEAASNVAPGMDLTNITAAGSYLSGQPFTRDATLAHLGIVTFNGWTNTVPSGSSAALTLGNYRQPSLASGQSVFITMTSYSGNGSYGVCSGTVLDAATTFAYATSPSTVISAQVNPTMSFTVAGRSGACNWVTPTSAATGTSIDLGHLNGNAPASGAQDLTLSTNAATGAALLIRSTGALNDGRGNSIANVAGSDWSNAAAFPSPGTAGFGYTLGWFGANKWAPTMTTGQHIAALTGPATWPDCIVFQAQASPSTPAGAYSTTVIYTAIPNF